MDYSIVYHVMRETEGKRTKNLGIECRSSRSIEADDLGDQIAADFARNSRETKKLGGLRF